MPRYEGSTRRLTKAARKRAARRIAQREPTPSSKTTEQHAVPLAFIGITDPTIRTVEPKPPGAETR